jgi:hypothetical protein
MRTRWLARLAGLALLLISVGLLTACTGGTLDLPGASSTATSGSAGPMPAAAEVLAKAQAVHLRDATMTTHINATQGGRTLALDGTIKETASPRRLAFATSGLFGMQGIIDGNTVYVDLGAGWVKTSLGQVGALASADPIALIEQMQQPQLVGAETVNGAATYHLRGMLPQPSDSGSGATANASTDTSTEDLWVRQDNFYPAKVAAQVNGTSSGQNVTADITGTFTAWNSGISIALPANAGQLDIG